ncbi:hypothetical protein [Clostridium beijerinckii]|uniref:hypothetical protein n=1 Tax=Clostridium beijerinckii TaxID=1520 RepID=UPI001A9B5E31|nr:hypothetical protein [Clostridium beijerinckii]
MLLFLNNNIIIIGIIDVITEIMHPDNIIIKYLLNLFFSKNSMISDFLDSIDDAVTKKNKFDAIIA